jgi:hypothetical protein
MLYGILISISLLFVKWEIGLMGLAVLIPSMIILTKIGKELKVNSVRELVELITRENYLKVRSESGTVNRKELKAVLTDLFSDMLEMDKDELFSVRFA